MSAIEKDDVQSIQAAPVTEGERKQTLREELGYIIDPEFQAMFGTKTVEEYRNTTKYFQCCTLWYRTSN